MSLRVETVKRWQVELNPAQDWLQYEVGVDGCYVVRIQCGLCNKHKAKIKDLRNFSPAFVNGIEGASLKKDNVKKHFQSEMHQKAAALEKLSGNVPNLPSALAQSIEEEHLTRLFDIAYTVAKLELPLAKFSQIAKLEVRHGVDLGQMSLTEQKCKEFLEYIGRSTKVELIRAIQESPYFSVLVDGSAETGATEKGMIYVLYVDHTGLPCVRFFGFREVEHVHADCLKRTVLNAFLEEGIDIERKLVGYLADSVTVKAGVATLLQNEMPYLIHMNCISHRLELTIKEMFQGTSFDDVTEMFLLLARLYRTCPGRMPELKSLSQIMQEGDIKSHQAEGTRWVQHKQGATKALLQAYPAVVCNLANMLTQTVLPKEKSIFQEYLQTLRSLKFILHLLFMSEMLEPLAKLSRSLQNSNVDLLDTAALLQKFYVTLGRMNNGILRGALSEVLKHTEKDPQSVFFGGTRLQADLEEARAFKEKLPSYVAAVSDCILQRFGSLHHMEPIQCLKILEVDLWPEAQEDLEDYGTSELQIFTGHFEKLLSLNHVDRTKLPEEWLQFKQFRKENLSQVSSQQLWQNLLTSQQSRFPNLYHAIYILHCFPVSSVVLEWGFSAVTRLKSNGRGKMSINILEYLTRISVEGPEPDMFDPGPAVSLYCFEQMGFITEPGFKRTSQYAFSDEEPESPNKRQEVCFFEEEYSSDD
ncbi:hypothetical protein AOXY_G9529 [Acipenser oxyrinchus oxyrinchus]|uniref:HAT C-terminal dimerisation domain-containing protein n=1 Tax=Acipenser oxyrinchus oxyrinchus TaxID=40147 RepID=A0AAD8DIB4_ACIOX|nr:hypothetical protein AOXY_G9529 [Acipenser oxyrinchus oxyrinchus]